MAKLLKGKAAADSLTETTSKKTEALRSRGVLPMLAIVRVGENPGDLSYEKGAVKRAAETGIDVKQYAYGEDVSQDTLISEIAKLNEDDSIHGVLILRPLPGHIDEKAVCASLAPAKDVDGITAGSMAGVFMDSDVGFPPCTAEACMEILNHYGYELQAKKVTVMGRSLVIGKPVAMMAMRKNATVTVCHSRTSAADFSAAGKNADILIAAVGKAGMIGADQLGENQIIIDVGINVNADGKLCGDVDFDAASETAAAVTPVPGGVGSVTTAVLMKHVAEAAERSAKFTA